jgi:hypothetical protein
MVWRYRSPIPVGRRGVICLFKCFQHAVTGLEKEGGGDRHPVAKLYLSVVRRGLLHVDPVQAEDDKLLLLLQLRLLPRAAAPLGVAVRAAPSSSLAAAPEFVLLFPARTEKTEIVITLSLSTGWGKLSVFQGRRGGGGGGGNRTS